MPKLFRIVAAATFVLLIVLMFRKWTGGGSAGEEPLWTPEPPEFGGFSLQLQHDPATRSLSWLQPELREDGSPLQTADIMAYIVIMLPATALGDDTLEDNFSGLSKSAFKSGKAQLGKALGADDIGRFAQLHSSFVAVLPAGQRSLVLGSSSGTHYAAISTVDAGGLHSELSNTVKLDLD